MNGYKNLTIRKIFSLQTISQKANVLYSLHSFGSLEVRGGRLEAFLHRNSRDRNIFHRSNSFQGFIRNVEKGFFFFVHLCLKQGQIVHRTATKPKKTTFGAKIKRYVKNRNKHLTSHNMSCTTPHYLDRDLNAKCKQPTDGRSLGIYAWKGGKLPRRNIRNA